MGCLGTIRGRLGEGSWEAWTTEPVKVRETWGEFRKDGRIIKKSRIVKMDAGYYFCT